jgi:hypothetical protein
MRHASNYTMICKGDTLRSPLSSKTRRWGHKFPHGDHHEEKCCEHQVDEGTNLRQLLKLVNNK